MFERFTEDARAAVVAAQHEARALEHTWIGTEHLLLGVLARPASTGARLLGTWGLTAEDARSEVEMIVGPGDPSLDRDALATLGIDLDEVRRRVEASFGAGALARRCGPVGAIPFTPRAKKVLELALRETLSLGHRGIGTEHIVLGVLRDGRGVAAVLLLRRGVTLEKVRAIVAGRPAA
jgi:ATP-dependent Clp protease ATP-binding subunit ClpA